MLTTLVVVTKASGLGGDGKVSYPLENQLSAQSVGQLRRTYVSVENKVYMEILELFDAGFLDSLLEALGKVLFDAD